MAAPARSRIRIPAWPLKVAQKCACPRELFAILLVNVRAMRLTPLPLRRTCALGAGGPCGDRATLDSLVSVQRTTKWGTDMKQLMKLAAAAALGAIASGTIVYAQAGSPEPPKARVALYRAAPGQHVALLRWFAQQDQAAQAAGVGRSQLYAHTDGDSWDYLIIDPVTTPAQDAAIDAALKKMGEALARPSRWSFANRSRCTPTPTPSVR